MKGRTSVLKRSGAAHAGRGKSAGTTEAEVPVVKGPGRPANAPPAAERARGAASGRSAGGMKIRKA